MPNVLLPDLVPAGATSMVKVLFNTGLLDFARVIRSTIPLLPSGSGKGSPSTTISLTEFRDVVVIRMPVKRQKVPARNNSLTGKLLNPRHAARTFSARRVLYPTDLNRFSRSETAPEADISTTSSNISARPSFV